jgi:hypothetical protein
VFGEQPPKMRPKKSGPKNQAQKIKQGAISDSAPLEEREIK